MSFNASCSRHGVILADRCNECEAPCIPHRGEFLACHNCEADLRKHPLVIGESVALQAEYALQKLARNGTHGLWRFDFSHSIAFFDTWFHLMGLIAFGARAERLRRLISKTYGGKIFSHLDGQEKLLDNLTPSQLHKIHGQVARMMEGYPFRMVGLCAETGNWSSQLLKDMRHERYDFIEPVKNYLAAPVIAKGKAPVPN